MLHEGMQHCAASSNKIQAEVEQALRLPYASLYPVPFTSPSHQAACGGEGIQGEGTSMDMGGMVGVNSGVHRSSSAKPPPPVLWRYVLALPAVAARKGGHGLGRNSPSKGECWEWLQQFLEHVLP